MLVDWRVDEVEGAGAFGAFLRGMGGQRASGAPERKNLPANALLKKNLENAKASLEVVVALVLAGLTNHHSVGHDEILEHVSEYPSSSPSID
ncbi:hypothetical protein E2562_002750 [Oryza meyeriana var. granulata]|uniref:Uncharacterized protein n=1 Tax=Oryza meyeriana var. granulata TaxID=110450 RepID=A0A6G1BRH1_9ORYZ|nr:hypothetical protein E2562_002750 [Oryza meyeriana var. granulata]